MSEDMQNEKHKYFNTNILLDAFDKWHTSFHSLLKEKNKLKVDFEAANIEKSRLADSNVKLKSEYDVLQNALQESNSQLERIAVLEDEIRGLKGHFEEKNNQIEDMKRQLSEEKRKHAHVVEQTKRDIEDKLTKTTEQLKTEASIEKELLQTQLNARLKDLEETEKKVLKLEKDKEAEICRISLEYENKLARLQRMKSQAVQNQSSTANNDIFRKKLQNMKVEYDSQISNLKFTIASLEERLANAQPMPQPLKQRQPLGLAKRKRTL